jgi:hypothetical protein
LETDKESIRRRLDAGVSAELSDATTPSIRGDESLACFNLILHHLVGHDDAATQALQARALEAWQRKGAPVFVHEYIYESYVFTDLSGYLIWKITSQPLLSRIGKTVAKVVPSLRANTFGVGVRFRSKDEWLRFFAALGFEVVGYVKGPDEGVSWPRRLLTIKHCRRDSFLLRPTNTLTSPAASSRPPHSQA